MTLDSVPAVVEKAAQHYAERLVEIAPQGLTVESGAVTDPQKT